MRLKLLDVCHAADTSPNSTELELEDRTCISLTIIDTPGFGDEIDNETRLETKTLSIPWKQCEYNQDNGVALIAAL